MKVVSSVENEKSCWQDSLTMLNLEIHLLALGLVSLGRHGNGNSRAATNQILYQPSSCNPSFNYPIPANIIKCDVCL